MGLAGNSYGKGRRPNIPLSVEAYGGSFDGTPVFLGCSDVDPHIPKRRVDETAVVLEQMHAAVTKRIYPGMGHTINADELSAVQSLLDRLAFSNG